MSEFNVDLTGRVAIVTGASRRQGLGAAICRMLAAHGADLVFTHWSAFDRTQSYGGDPEGPAALARELAGLGVRVADIELDLGDPDAARRLIDITTALLGPPAILVNNAAHDSPTSYQTLDAAALDQHYAVNLRATMLLSTAFARQFTAGAGGRIISLSSGQAVGPMPESLAYAATKGAIEAFTMSLAPAVAPLGITVNAVDPGGTDTGWMPAELKATIQREMGFGRVGLPTDAARLILFLASDAGAWITGQTLHSRGA